jgi:hypothetical protein
VLYTWLIERSRESAAADDPTPALGGEENTDEQDAWRARIQKRKKV